MSLTTLPKITELDYSSLSKENVLWFHVPVKNPVRVQIVQGLDKLAGNLSDLKIPKVRKSHVNSGQRKTIITCVLCMSTKQCYNVTMIQWLNGWRKGLN